MVKRVELMSGYLIDMDSSNMTLKSNVKMVLNAKGEENESSSIHGYFTSYKSLFNKLHKLLTIEKLKKNNNIADLINAIKESDEQIDKLCDMLEGDYRECSIEFASDTNDSDNDE